MFITTDGRTISVNLLGKNRFRVRIGSPDVKLPATEHDLTNAEARYLLTTRPDPVEQRAAWQAFETVTILPPDVEQFAEALASALA